MIKYTRTDVNYAILTKRVKLQLEKKETCIEFKIYHCLSTTGENQGVSQLLFDDFYVIFPIHLNFPIMPKCVFKAVIHIKKLDCFTVT